MSGAIFLLDVIAFVALVYWTYRGGQRPGGEEDGVFGVKPDFTAPDLDKPLAGPRWRRSRGREPAAARGDSVKKPPAAWRFPRRPRRGPSTR